MEKRTGTALAAFFSALLIALLCIGALAAGAKWPAASSKGMKKSGKLQVSAANTAEGYFMAAVSKKNKRKLKLRVTKGKQSLSYDLRGDGEYEVFPLQLGDGKYEVSLWENVSGKKYSSAGKISLNVKLKSKTLPFLYPNQYVNYTKASEAVKKAEALCKGKSAAEAFQIIQEFMSKSFVYDYVKAITIQAGMLPDIDGCYSKKMGVCQDLSAIMVCMLRTQGIPSKLVIGYADNLYHAWTETTINGKEVFFYPTAALSAITLPHKYTVERFY